MQPTPESFEHIPDANTAPTDPATLAALHFQDIYRNNPEDKQALNLAFSELVNMTYPMLWHELVGRGLKDDAAQDVLQNTYLKAFKSLSEGKFEGRSKVSTWLYRGLFNNRYNYLSAEGRKRYHELSQEELEGFDIAETGPDLEENVLDYLTGKTMDANIHDILTQLNASTQERKVWALRNEGLHYAEIAVALGITAAAARVCYYRIKEKIKSRYPS